MHGILVGVDGSGQSSRALEWAVREAAVREVPLTVLSVNQAVAGYTGVALPYGDDAEREAQVLKAAGEQVDRVLTEVAGTAKLPQLDVRAATGFPAEVLLAAAQDADMIVVGSRGAGGFRLLLLGSVSAQVTHHAHCPVVVIPAGRARGAETR
jgi:nucleotide-binding universal stress UspA family protein